MRWSVILLPPVIGGILTVMIVGTHTSRVTRTLLLAGAWVVVAGGEYLLGRWRARDQDSPVDVRPPRRLTDLYKARGSIRVGDWVTFTDGGFDLGDGEGSQYVTAIGEVERVGADEVDVRWRDCRDAMPAQVPVDLIDARYVWRWESGRRIRHSNDGLVVINHGGTSKGPGWRWHRANPERVAGHRLRELGPTDRAEFLERARWESYDEYGMG